MYIGDSFHLADMELAERRRVAARHRLVRDAREERGEPRFRGMPDLLDGLRKVASFQRLTRAFRPA